MSTAAIIGMVTCLTITFGGFFVFLVIALRADKDEDPDTGETA